MCVILPAAANFAISHARSNGGAGSEAGDGDTRGRNWRRVMYYRTGIDYWKRYQSYKHSLPLILQSCDVEPSHRRPSLLIPPPAISLPSPPLLSRRALHLALFRSFSRFPSPFVSIRCPPSLPAKPLSPSSCFSHSLCNGVYGVSHLRRMSCWIQIL